MRNVAFFLTPKHELAYLNKDATVRQAIEKFENHGSFLEIIVLDTEGRFVGILSSKDLLLAFKKIPSLNFENSHVHKIKDLHYDKNVITVNIDTSSDVLVEISKVQNIIPVIDGENRFIGIVRRANLLFYYYQKAGINEDEQ